jgi:hypothetical protein
MALIDCPEAEVMNEVGVLIRNECRTSPLKDYEYGRLFNKVFGVACDPIDGKSIDAPWVRAWCPHCKSNNTETYEMVPRVSVAVKVPLVTHKAWNALTEEQKRSLIRRRLAEVGEPAR